MTFQQLKEENANSGYLASQDDSPDGYYSALVVMKSPAGYYIGTIFHHNDGSAEPGSRESQYFPSKTTAEEALQNESWEQRLSP